MNNGATSVASWIAQIDSVLRVQNDTPSGRAGETPIGMLIDAINRLDPDSGAAQNFTRALDKTIRQSGTARASYWRDLTDLIESVHLARSSIQSTVWELLLRGQPRDLEARAWALVAVTAVGRKLTPADLESFSDIKRSFPRQWISAAVSTGLFDLASNEVGDLLHRKLLRAADVLAMLPDWYQKLGPDLTRFISGWMQECSLTEDKDKLGRWMRARRLTPSAPTEAQGRVHAWGSHFGEHSRTQSPLSSMALNFLAGAKSRSPRLNGAGTPHES